MRLRLSPVRDSRGVTLVELLVAVAIFLFVVFGMGALYVSAKRGFDYGSAEAFIQRQGTLVQQELTRHVVSANSLQVLRCSDTNPSGMAANKSIVYSRYYPGRAPGSQTEYWCVFEYRHTGPTPPADAFTQLWRCPVAGLTADQLCTTGAENMLPPVPASIAGQRLEVLNTSFTPASIRCGATPCGPTSVNVQFTLDLHAQTTNASLLFSAKTLVFNVTLRN